MYQSPDEVMAQARKDADELTQAIHDKLLSGRIKETFTGERDEEGNLITYAAPTAKEQSFRMMAVYRLLSMEKQDDGTFAITLNPAAIKQAVEDKRAAAEKAQALQAAQQQHIEGDNARAERMRAIDQQAQERRDYALWRESIRSKI